MPINVSFLWQHPAHFIACGAGSGLSPIAPGTVASFLTWWAYNLWIAPLPELRAGAVVFLLFVIGYWAVEQTITSLQAQGGSHDPGAIVIDEIAATALLLWLITPTSSNEQFIALLAFRFFDSVKPFSIRRFEARHANAFGVMADDVLAVAYTVLLIALWRLL